MSLCSDQVAKPFILHFVERVNSEEFATATACMTEQIESYDPITQTSNISDMMMAGTSKTYTQDTGVWADDTKCTDT